MTSFCSRAAVLAAAFLPALAAGQALTLDQALALAAQRSEAARAGRAAAASADASARTAGQLPDPTLHLAVENLPATGAERFSTTADGQTMKRVGLSQAWRSGDKRAARDAAARAMAERARLRAGIAEADARLQAGLAYLEAWYAGAALQLAVQTRHHADEALAATRARLAAAAVGSAELLQLDAASGLAEDEQAAARQQHGAALVALQRWIGPAPDGLAEPPAFGLPDEPDYVARSPEVAALRQDVEVARRDAAVTAAERSPDWTWELSYGQRTGAADMVSLGVSIPLPVARAARQDRETAARLALVERAEAELAEAERAAGAAYRSLAGDAARLQQRIERYRTAVLAPAGQRTAVVLAAYRANAAPVSAWFEARHAEVEAQRRLLGLEQALATTQARLALRPLADGVPR